MSKNEDRPAMIRKSPSFQQLPPGRSNVVKLCMWWSHICYCNYSAELGGDKNCYRRWFRIDHLEGGQITAVATPKTSPLLTGPYLLLKGKHQRNYMRIRHCIKHTSTLHQGIHPPVHGIAPIITLQPKMAFRHQQVRHLVPENTCIYRPCHLS